jgi:hypothetical protein
MTRASRSVGREVAGLLDGRCLRGEQSALIAIREAARTRHLRRCASGCSGASGFRLGLGP